MSEIILVIMIVFYIMVIYMVLEVNGFDVLEVFRVVGLSDILSQDFFECYIMVQMVILFCEFVKFIGNFVFGFIVVCFLYFFNVYVLGYVLLVSLSLWDVCERLVYYFCIVSNQGVYCIDEFEDCYCLVLEEIVDGVVYEIIDIWNVFFICVFWMIYLFDFVFILVLFVCF